MADAAIAMAEKTIADARAVDGALARLAQLHPKLIDLSLDRVIRLMRALGDPQDKLPPVIHVAGTNGKGSTIAFMRAILEAAGYRVHVYISPHLVRFNERIRLAGSPISDADLVRDLETCEAANSGQPITFFEITTAAAFLAFARVPADIVLLETGLGGRLDATNLVKRPALTAIAPISIDHTQYLGETLAEIAREKAGILKPGIPAVIARQPDEAGRVLEAVAAQRGAPLYRQDRDWRVAPHHDGFAYRASGTAIYPKPALIGPHQIENAGLALACLERLSEFRIDDTAIARGLRGVEWHARLQPICDGPMVDLVRARTKAGEWEIWLDGGHNPGAGEVLAKAIAEWPRRPLDLVFGMLSVKNPVGFLRPLAPLVRRARHVPVPGEHASMPADMALGAARAAGIADVGSAASPQQAIRSLLAQTDGTIPDAGRILICGSLYLAGSILAAHR